MDTVTQLVLNDSGNLLGFSSTPLVWSLSTLRHNFIVSPDVSDNVQGEWFYYTKRAKARMAHAFDSHTRVLSEPILQHHIDASLGVEGVYDAEVES